VVEKDIVVEVALTPAFSQREREMSLPQPPPKGRGEKRAPEGGGEKWGPKGERCPSPLSPPKGRGHSIYSSPLRGRTKEGVKEGIPRERNNLLSPLGERQGEGVSLF